MKVLKVKFSSPFTPDSFIVGTSGSSGMRLSDETAMARILPLLMWPMAALTWSTWAVTWPAITSMLAAPDPL
ncbi:hypothetical protein D3C83_245450 [compost metagenome]